MSRVVPRAFLRRLLQDLYATFTCTMDGQIDIDDPDTDHADFAHCWHCYAAEGMRHLERLAPRKPHPRKGKAP